MSENTSRKIRITLIKSMIGRPEKHCKILKALGLYKTNQTVNHFETPIIQGMIRKITHLIKVEAA